MEIINRTNYVDVAEEVILGLIRDAEKNKGNQWTYKILSTSQIRKQLSMTAELFSQVETDKSTVLSEEILDKIQYLRMQFIYQAGRDKEVKAFVQKAKIQDILKSINNQKENFLVFCRYMEALVAFRKYHGNKDD